MGYRSLVVALFGLSLTGCAVYGGGYAYDYGYPGYDRYYTTDHYYVERYPVYVAPRVYYRDGHHDDGHRYGDRRYEQRRYLPASQTPHHNQAPRYRQRFDQGRQDGQGRDDRHQQRNAQGGRTDDRHPAAQGRRDYGREQPQHWQRQARQPQHDVQRARGHDPRDDGRSAQGHRTERKGQAQQKQTWRGRNAQPEQTQGDSQRPRQGDRRDWPPRVD